MGNQEEDREVSDLEKWCNENPEEANEASRKAAAVVILSVICGLGLALLNVFVI